MAAPRPEPPAAAFDALVSGRVQGVGFRYSAVEEARNLGLVGWVRNTPDGDVELHAEGGTAALADFAEWLYEGPPGARVTNVSLNKCEPTGHFDRFIVEF